jgi:DNA invertase Pin-like site-specific DNA recombinase
MLVGYARVSTEDQNLDLQKDALQKAGCVKLFTDIASGAGDERVGLAEAIAFLRRARPWSPGSSTGWDARSST